MKTFKEFLLEHFYSDQQDKEKTDHESFVNSLPHTSDHAHHHSKKYGFHTESILHKDKVDALHKHLIKQGFKATKHAAVGHDREHIAYTHPDKKHLSVKINTDKRDELDDGANHVEVKSTMSKSAPTAKSVLAAKRAKETKRLKGAGLYDPPHYD